MRHTPSLSPVVSRRTLLTASAALATTGAIGWHSSLPGAEPTESDDEGEIHQVAVKLTKPRSGKDKRMGDALDTCTVSLFLPRGAKELRGATFNPFHEPTVKQSHWRAAAAAWGFAHGGANFFGVHFDEQPEVLLEALRLIAQRTGRAEIAHLPLCFQGMSIGGGLSARLTDKLAERTIASAPVCLEVGPTTEGGRGVPVLTIFGERDGRQMELLEGKLPAARAEGAQWAIAPQWGQKHEWHRASNIILPFYERVAQMRLPREMNLAAGPAKLVALDERQGWIGSRDNWKSPAPAIARAVAYSGDPMQGNWLPDSYTAAVWQSFVSYDSPLKIASPAGMGDGTAFKTFSASEPLTVELAVRGELAAEKVVICDGDRVLATIGGDVRTATLGILPPGCRCLIASATLKDGSQVISPPNTIVVR